MPRLLRLSAKLAAAALSSWDVFVLVARRAEVKRPRVAAKITGMITAIHDEHLHQRYAALTCG